MDGYFKSLSLSCNTILEDVLQDCIKILDWVYKTSQKWNSLTDIDVQNLAKGILFLNNCFILFEFELPNRLLELYPFFEKQINTFFVNGPQQHSKRISHILENVAQTENGLEHLYTLESILNNFYEPEDEARDLEYSLIETATKNSQNCKLYTIIQKIFQLPEEQIDFAIDRMLTCVPFSVIGLVFCEPKNSFYIDICFILSHKIYEKLLDGSISTFFVRSLYESVSISQSGKRFYCQCLKSTDFANGMCSFFIRALSHISRDDHEDIWQKTFEKHRLNHVIFLFWIACSALSPCHTNLYKRINDAGLTKCLTYLSKFERIYD